MCELRNLLGVAPYRPPFTSDDVNGARPSLDPMYGGDPKVLVALAVFFRAGNPNATWRDFTRWLS